MAVDSGEPQIMSASGRSKPNSEVAAPLAAAVVNSTGAGEGKVREARLSWASAWAVLGVIAFLSKGLMRCIPVAMQPIREGLGPWGWVAYALTGVSFAYLEGYRGFQQKFSPLVVSRALLLNGRQPCARQAFAPCYAMAFFHARRRRQITSFALIFVIFGVVSAVKHLPYPYRAIIDAGVCIGLAWGIGSIACIYLRALHTGRAPDFDPCLPEP